MAGDTFKVGLNERAVRPVRPRARQVPRRGRRAGGRAGGVRAAYIPHVPELGGGQIFGGVAVDGGGFVVINGKVIKVPPRGPARELVESVAGYLEAGTEQPSQVAALESVMQSLGDAARDIELVSHTPPGVERLEGL